MTGVRPVLHCSGPRCRDFVAASHLSTPGDISLDWLFGVDYEVAMADVEKSNQPVVVRRLRDATLRVFRRVLVRRCGRARDGRLRAAVLGTGT